MDVNDQIYGYLPGGANSSPGFVPEFGKKKAKEITDNINDVAQREKAAAEAIKKKRAKELYKPESDEASISESAKFINDMYEFSEKGKADLEALMNEAGLKTHKVDPTIKSKTVFGAGLSEGSFMSPVKQEDRLSELMDISFNTSGSRLEALYDIVKDTDGDQSSLSGITDFDIYRSINSGTFKSGLLESYKGEDSVAPLKKGEALNLIAMEIGGKEEAFNRFLKDRNLFKDTSNPIDETAAIAGFDVDKGGEWSQLIFGSLSDFLVSVIDVVKSPINGFEIDEDEFRNRIDLFKERLAAVKNPGVRLEDVLDWQINTPSGRHYVEEDKARKAYANSLIKDVRGLIDPEYVGSTNEETTYLKEHLKKIQEENSRLGLGKTDSEMNTEARNAVENDSRARNMAKAYILSSEAIMAASSPGVGGWTDIPSEVWTGITKKLPAEFRTAFSAIGSLTGERVSFSGKYDPRKIISDKLDNALKNDPLSLDSEDGLKKVLSRDEFALLKAMSVFDFAGKAKEDNMSMSASTGSALYDSLKFILELAGSKGMVKGLSTLAKGASGMARSTSTILKGYKSGQHSALAFGTALRTGNFSKAGQIAAVGVAEGGKTLAQGAFMPSTYTNEANDNATTLSTTDADPLGFGLINKVGYTEDKLSDYANSAFENSVMALVEKGGIIKPGLKVAAGLMPKVARAANITKPLKDALNSTIAAAGATNAVRAIASSRAYAAAKNMWNNPAMKAFHIENPFDELFEEFEEAVLMGDDLREFFATKNLLTTIYTVGLFSGGFAAVNPARYAASAYQHRMAKNDINKTLIDVLGFNSDVADKFMDLLDNTPITSLEPAIKAFTSRAYIGAASNMSKDNKTQNAANKAYETLIKASARYAGNAARMSALANRLPSEKPEDLERFLTEAISPLESNIAQRSVSMAVNKETGMVEQVNLFGLQRAAFLLSGADKTEDGTYVPTTDEDGNQREIEILIPSTGDVISLPFSNLNRKSGKTIAPESLVSELSSHNTKLAVEKASIDPTGYSLNARTTQNMLNKTDLENENVTRYEKGDQFVPLRRNPLTGKLGSWTRLVKDDEFGTYKIVDVDAEGGAIVVPPAKGKATPEGPADLNHGAKAEYNPTTGKMTETMPEKKFDPNARKGRKAKKAKGPINASKVNFRVDDEFDEFEDDDSSSYDMDSMSDFAGVSETYDGLDTTLAEFPGDSEAQIETTPEAAAEGKSHAKIQSESEIKSEIDSMRHDNDAANRVTGNTEDMFMQAGPTESLTGGAIFAQRHERKGEDSFGEAEDLLPTSLGDRMLVSEDDIIRIRKLSRAATKRRIDRLGDKVAKTLIFINFKERSYDKKGKVIDEVAPQENSSPLLSSEWFDNAEVSITTTKLETKTSSGRSITTAPVVVFTDPGTGEELLFTLKSPNILKALHADGSITSDELSRGISMYNTLVDAARKGQGLNLAVAIGKPKMNSFRQARLGEQPVAKTIKSANVRITGKRGSKTSETMVNPDEIIFNFRVEDVLYTYSKGDTSAKTGPIVSDVGSRTHSSMSMLPPLVVDSNRDYTPTLGPALDSKAKADFIAEIILSDRNNTVKEIADVYTEEAFVQDDMVLLSLMRHTGMSVGDFKSLFLTSDFTSVDGVQVLGNNLYVNGKRIGKLEELSHESVSNAIQGHSLSLNMPAFFDPSDLSQIPLMDLFKLDEASVASSTMLGKDQILGNDLHGFLYNYAATTTLDYGLYDPPFLFIAEKDEFEMDDDIEAMSTVSKQRIRNHVELTPEMNAALEAMYEASDRAMDEIRGTIYEDTSAAMISALNKLADGNRVDFKLSDTPNAGEISVMSKVAVQSVKWLAKKLFNADVVIDPAEIAKAKQEIADSKETSERDKRLIKYNLDGFTYNGKLYIEKVTGDVLGHEIAHFVIDALRETLPAKEVDAMERSVIAAALAANPSLVRKKRKQYGSLGIDAYIEVFCDSFGTRFNSGMAEKTFAKALGQAYINFVNIFAKLFGTSPATMPAFAYRDVAKRAFRGSLSDFPLLNEMFHRKGQTSSKIAKLIARFSSKENINLGGFGFRQREAMEDILKNTPKRKLFKDANGNKTTLSREEWLFTQTKEFKDATANGLLRGENGEPLRVYINVDDPHTGGMLSVSDSMQSNTSVSGFLATDKIAKITDESIINQMILEPGKLDAVLSEMFFGDVDAVEYTHNGKRNIILRNSSTLMTSALTDSMAASKSSDSQAGLRKNKAMALLDLNVSPGTIAAVTGFYPDISSDGVTVNLIEIEFNDEYTKTAAVKKAIESGEEVRLSDLYSNEELLNMVTNKDIRVKIVQSGENKNTIVAKVGNVVTVNLGAGVRMADYKQVFRDVVFNLIEHNNSTGQTTPFYIYSDFDKSSSSETHSALEFYRSAAIDMYIDIATSGVSGDALEAKKAEVVELTGWKMMDDGTMVSGLHANIGAISNRINRVSNKIKLGPIDLSEILPAPLVDAIGRPIKVVFSNSENMGSNSVSVHTLNGTMYVSSPLISVDNNGNVLMSSVETIAEAVTSEAAKIISNNNVSQKYGGPDVFSLANVEDIEKVSNAYDKFADENKDTDTGTTSRIIADALRSVLADYKIWSTKPSSQELIDMLLSISEEYLPADDANSKSILSEAIPQFIAAISSNTSKPKIYKGGSILGNPILKTVKNQSASNALKVEYFSTGDVTDRVNFKIDDTEGSSEPTIMSVEDAYKNIVVKAINEIVEKNYTPKHYNAIIDTVTENLLSRTTITGTANINSLVNQFSTELKESVSTVISDFYNFIEFIPYEYKGKSSIMDQKKLKDFLYSTAPNFSNVNDFKDKLIVLSNSGDPIAKGIVKFAKLASNAGMSNYYERLHAQFNQRRTVFTDKEGVNRTEEQLAINQNSLLGRVGELAIASGHKFIKGVSEEAVDYSGDDGGNSDAIIVFFERFGHHIDKRTADLIVTELGLNPKKAVIEWAEELTNKTKTSSLKDPSTKDSATEDSSKGVNPMSKLGSALIRSIIINNRSDAASVKTGKSTFPAMSKENAISRAIDDVSSMTRAKYDKAISEDAFMHESQIIESVLKGSSIELRKQVDELGNLESAAVSDIAHLLAGHVSLNKVSDDGTRYYIAGSNIFGVTFTMNSNRAMKADKKLKRFTEARAEGTFASRFVRGSSKLAALTKTFNKYAMAEMEALLDCHKIYSMRTNGRVSGYHISKDGKPGHGTKFSQLMSGVSLSINVPGNGILSGSLSEILEGLEALEAKKQLTESAISFDTPKFENYTKYSKPNEVYEAAVKAHGDFMDEFNRMKDSGYLAKPGALARVVLKQLMMNNDVSLNGLYKEISLDTEKLIKSTPGIFNAMSDLGLVSTTGASQKDLISLALLRKRISEIEAYKIIYGSPNQYGGLTKAEKRTKSFNSTWTAPTRYDESNTRPNGEIVSREFANNTFKVEFGKDLAKDNVEFYNSSLDTIGAVMISPYLYREIMIRTRGWTNDAEAEFQNLIAAGKSGGKFSDTGTGIKFNPLKLLYPGSYIGPDGKRVKTLIKAQFVPLFSDPDGLFGDMYEKFTDPDLDKRIHMYAMEDSVKTGFADGASAVLDFNELGMISIPKDSKPNNISLLRKLMSFSNANLNSAMESMLDTKLADLADEMFDDSGRLNIDIIRHSDLTSKENADLSAALDIIQEMQDSDPTLNPLDVVGMFDVVANRINSMIADAFDFDVNGIQCSAVSERTFTTKPLKFINEVGTMDIMVPISYFDDIVGGLSYNDAVAKLTELGYIGGKNSSAIIARNPIQAESSISPARIVGVFPRAYGYMISAPSEFLTANGGDLDGDKYFLFPVSNKNAPEANSLIYNLLKQERTTMTGNVDAEVKAIEDAHAALQEALASAGVSTNASTPGRYSDQYLSEVSGLGLVGICVNMISGMLTYFRNDVSPVAFGSKLVKSEAEIAASKAVVSGLFSLAVDIANNPLLQELGVDPYKFRPIFTLAVLTDLDTTVKFMNSKLMHATPDMKSREYSFNKFTNPEIIKEIVNKAVMDPNSELTEDEVYFVNTIGRFSKIFSALKHSEDFSDYVRDKGYFDSLLQSIKIDNEVSRITKTNTNIISFSAANSKATSRSNVDKKLNMLSIMLGASSAYFSSDIVNEVFKSKAESSIDEDFDKLDSFGNKLDYDEYKGFKHGVILKDISAYVSAKIGKTFFKANFPRLEVIRIRDYMKARFNISFLVGDGYIHTITASPDNLYDIGEKYDNVPEVIDFFRMYYASAAQRGDIINKNKNISAGLNPDGSEIDVSLAAEFGDIQYLPQPGPMISLKQAAKFGVIMPGANEISIYDTKTIGREVAKVRKPSSSESRSIISLLSPVQPSDEVSNGSKLKIQVNSTTSDSDGNVFDSSKAVYYDVNAAPDSSLSWKLRDLIYSIENGLPYINVLLESDEVLDAIAAITRARKKNGKSTDVHILTDNDTIAHKYASGTRTTSSNKLSDAPDGAIIIAIDFNNAHNYIETVIDMDEAGNIISADKNAIDLASSRNYTIVNIAKSRRIPQAYGSVGASIPATHKVNKDGLVNVLKANADYFPVTAGKVFVPFTVGGLALYKNVGDAGLRAVKVRAVRKVDGALIVDIIDNGIVTSVNPSKESSVELKSSISITEANKLALKKAIIVTGNASRLNQKSFTNIHNFKIVEVNDAHDSSFDNTDISNSDEMINKCSI